jgi:predicted HTH domain antitoxin
MTPEAMDVVRRAINEVNQKVLAENREDAFNEGIDIGIKLITKNLRDKVDLGELSEVTGLTVDEIKKL